MHEATPIENDAALAQAIFELGAYVRYVAVANGGDVSTQERPGLTASSSSNSDFFEELLVNPALLLLTTRRGDIDCGGLRHVIVGYGNFNQVVLPTRSGHVSVAVEKDTDVTDAARAITAIIASAATPAVDVP